MIMTFKIMEFQIVIDATLIKSPATDICSGGLNTFWLICIVLSRMMLLCY